MIWITENLKHPFIWFYVKLWLHCCVWTPWH